MTTERYNGPPPVSGYAPKKNSQGVPIADVLERAVANATAVDGPGPQPRVIDRRIPADPVRTSRRWIAAFLLDLTFREMNQVADELRKNAVQQNPAGDLDLAATLDNWAHMVYDEDSHDNVTRLPSHAADGRNRRDGE